MKKKVQEKKSSKMTSFQLFRDKNAKDWRESLKEMSDFFKKNRQWILIFLFGLATFPILFFLSVSLKEATTGLMRKMTAPKSTTRFPSPTPIKRPAVTPTPSATNSSGDQVIIGGDRDEYGCLTPAGYSWCESKSKCLRTWEETCPE